MAVNGGQRGEDEGDEDQNEGHESECECDGVEVVEGMKARSHLQELAFALEYLSA